MVEHLSEAVSAANSRPPMMELFFSIPMCAASLLQYHFAMILLWLNKPGDTTNDESANSRLKGYRQVSKEVEMHSREICGIALARPRAAVRIQMVQPLYVSGLCLESQHDRQTVINLLWGIQMDTGCATEYRINDLLAEWERES